ncbi:MAG: hypothetical protein H6581_27820 [Bacteroidia bacterium]|nr:hypothetical protein [Bacteroidia bacterium]
MQSPPLTLKILTLVGFFLLVIAFVSFRAGYFDQLIHPAQVVSTGETDTIQEPEEFMPGSKNEGMFLPSDLQKDSTPSKKVSVHEFYMDEMESTKSGKVFRPEEVKKVMPAEAPREVANPKQNPSMKEIIIPSSKSAPIFEEDDFSIDSSPKPGKK